MLKKQPAVHKALTKPRAAADEESKELTKPSTRAISKPPTVTKPLQKFVAARAVSKPAAPRRLPEEKKTAKAAPTTKEQKEKEFDKMVSTECQKHWGAFSNFKLIKRDYNIVYMATLKEAGA